MVLLLIFVFIVVVLLLIILTFVLPNLLQRRSSSADGEAQAAQLSEVQEELEQRKGEIEQLKVAKEDLERRIETLKKQIESVGDKQARLHRELEEAHERLRMKGEELEKVRAEKGEMGGGEDGQRGDERRLVVVEARLEEAREKIEKMLGEDLLINTPWLKLATGCVEIFDDLEKRRPSFDQSRQELIMYVCSQMELMLERAGVEVITDDAAFDEKRHKIEAAKDRIEPGAEIIETLSPGFMVGTRILRQAHVQVS